MCISYLGHAGQGGGPIAGVNTARRQILRASDSTNQVPTNGVPTVVKFGSQAVNGPGDAVQMTAANRFIFNQAKNLHLRLSTEAGRTASSGVGKLWLGVFLNTGSGFVQFGQSVGFVFANANSASAYQAELTADVLPGWEMEIRFQTADQADVGLFADLAVPNAWNDVFSADALISEYFSTVI